MTTSYNRIAGQSRIVIAQSLYVVGMLLCVFSTYLSVAPLCWCS
jgi:hypothetical protein